MIKKIVFEAQYFPPVLFFSFLMDKETIFLEAYENYQKHSFRNRCNILDSNGICNLSVPLLKGKNNQSPILETQIASFEEWQKDHIKSIQSAYGRAPFFEHYMPYINHLLNQKYDSLFALNEAILKQFLVLLDMKISLQRTDRYIKTYEAPYFDLRDKIRPNMKTDQFVFAQYEQVFSDRMDFVPNLSILDLLFCRGPESIQIIDWCYRNNHL